MPDGLSWQIHERVARFAPYPLTTGACRPFRPTVLDGPLIWIDTTVETNLFPSEECKRFWLLITGELPICTECAKREGLVWPKDKPVTDAEGVCSVCGEQRGVSPRREWV